MKNNFQFTAIAIGIIAASVLSSITLACKMPCNYKCDKPVCCERLMGGWYVGGQATYDSYRVRQTNSVLDPDLSVTLNPVFYAVGVGGGLFAGYGMYFDGPWYLGAEIWANASNAGAETLNISGIDADGNLFNYNQDIKGNWSWGLSVLPGYKLNCSTLTYIRLGYARHRLKISESFISRPSDPDDFSTSSNNWFSGFQYGFGVENVIKGPWTLRTEFNHTFLGSNSDNISRSTFSVSDNQFSLGLIYHFC